MDGDAWANVGTYSRCWQVIVEETNIRCETLLTVVGTAASFSR